MFGLVDVAVAAALVACGYALWVRRHAWSSRFDANPSRVLVRTGCTALLMSPVGPTFFDPLVHRVSGLWNIAGLLAALCIFGTARVMFEHLAMRLADRDLARVLGNRHIIMPLHLGLPLMVVVFVVADRGHPEYPDIFAPRGPWFGAYWMLVAALTVYLFGFTSRVLLALRNDSRSKASAEHYLVWAAFNIATVLAQLTSVLIGSTATLPSWICAGGSAVAFAYASVLSWQSRIDWFKPVRPPASEIAGD